MTKSLKQKLEAVWRARGIGQINNLARWHDAYPGCSLPGSPRKTLPGEVALRFRRKALSGHDFQAWPQTVARDIVPSRELCGRYREDCPNNAKALIAGYEKTRTEYDDPRQFGAWVHRFGQTFFDHSALPLLEWAARRQSEVPLPLAA